MKINKELLQMKFHYFFVFAGSAPLLPFLPVYAKQNLKISYSGIGLIYTVLPFLGLLSKMFSGALADLFNAHRKIFLTSIIVCGIGFFSIYFAPTMPTESNTARANIHFDCSSPTSYLRHTSSINQCNNGNWFKSNQTATCDIICETTASNMADLCKFWNVSEPPYNEELEFSSFSILNHFVEDGIEYFFPVSNLTFVGHEVNYPMCDRPIRLNCTAKCDNNELMSFLDTPNFIEYFSYSDIMSQKAFWIFFLCISIPWCGYAVLVVMSDTICFQLLGVNANKYGQQRLFGSVGWGVMVIITGILIDLYSDDNYQKYYGPAFILAAAVFSVDFLVASRLKVQIGSKGQFNCSDVIQLIVQPRIFIFILCCIIVGISTGVLWTYQFMLVEHVAFTWNCGFKYMKLLEGLMMGVSSFGGELPFFFLSGLFIKKLGHINAMSLVIFTFGVRFILYYTVTNPWLFLPIELLNGLTFGIFYSVMTSYASLIAPSGSEATMQGLVGASFEGLGIALGGLIGGALCRRFGEPSAYLYVGIFSIIFAIAHIVAHIILNKFYPLVSGELI